MSKKIGLILLIAIVIGGVALIYQQDKIKQVSGEAGKEEVATKLCVLKGNFVRAEVKSEDMITLEKQENKWINPEEPDLEYDSQGFHSWLFTLRNLEGQEVFYPEDKSVYGIDEQSTLVTLYDEMNESQTLRIGKVDSNNEVIYVEVDQLEGIYSIPIQIGTELLVSPNQFVICKLDKPNLETVNTISLMTKNHEPIILEKYTGSDEERWYLTDYYTSSHALENEVISQIMSVLETMKLKRFVGKVDQEEYGFDEPELIVTLNEKWQLIFGTTTEQEVYVKRNDSNLVYTMDKNVLETLASYKPFEMITKKVIDMPNSLVKEITLENPQSQYKLVVSQEAENEGTAIGQGQLNDKALSEEELEELLTTIKDSICLEAVLQNPDIEQKEERKAEIIISFALTNEIAEKIELIPYDINYYILRMNGVIEFAVNKAKVTKLFNTLNHKLEESK